MERTVRVRLEAPVDGFVANVGVKAVAAVGKLGDAADRVGTRIDRTATRVEQSSRRLSNTIAANAKKAGDAAERNSAHIDRIGDASTKVGIAAAAGLGLAAKAAIDWESAWAGVAKTVDASDAQLASLEGQLRGMAKTLPATHGEIAAVAEAAGQLGVRVNDIASFTRVMVDLGETTNLTSDEAATSLAQLMNVLQTAPEDVGRLGAAVVALGNDGASTERDIVSMAQRISSTGAIVGLSETQVLGYAAALANVGIEAEAGGSAISSVFVKIDQAVSEGGDKLDLFAQLAGTTTADFKRQFETDASGATLRFIEGLGQLNKAGGDVNGTMEQLGLTEIRQRNAVLSLAASGDNLSESLRVANQGWQDNTALVDEAAKRYATTESQVRIAWNQIKDAGITAGAELLPVIRDMATGVADMAEFFGDLPAPVQKTVVVLGAVVAAGGLLIGTASKAITTVTELRSALTALGLSGTRASAGMAALGKAGLVVGLVVLSKEIEHLVDVTKEMDLSGLTGDLLRFGETGKVTGELAKNFGDDLGGVAAKLRADGPSLAEVFQTAGREADSNLEKFEAWIDGGSEAASRVHELDEALAQLVEGGNQESAAKAFERLSDLARQQGVSYDTLVKLLPSYQAAVEAAGVDTQIAGQKAATTAKSNVVLQDSMNGVTVSAEDAEDALDAYIDALFRVPGLVLGVRAAQREVQSAIDDATASVKENGRTLDIDTEKGRANQAALDAIASSANKLSEEYVRTNASQKTMTDAAKTAREEFVRVAVRMGQNRAEAKALAERLIKIPKRVTTTVTNNAGPTQKPSKDAQTYANLLLGKNRAGIPRAVTTFVGNNTAGAPKTQAQVYADILTGRNRAGIPNSVSTGVTTTGIPAAQLKAETYARVLLGRAPNGVPNFVETRVDAKTAKARADIAAFVGEVNRSLNGISDETVNVGLAFAESGAGHTPKNASGKNKHADGGGIGGFSPSPTADNIPIWATAGEHMWTVAETQAVGGHGAMERLRAAALRGDLRGFATGGGIGDDVHVGVGVGGAAAVQAAISRTANARVAAFAKEIAKEAFTGGGGPNIPPGRVRNFRGERLNERTIAMLLSAERILGATFNIMQGSYSTRVAASGSTHAGGGVLDTDGPRGWNAAVRALRAVGFAAWPRTPAQGPWGYHIHSVAKGDPTESAAAKAQVRDFLRGGDGLSGGGSARKTATASTASRTGGHDVLAKGGPVKRPPLLTAIDPNRFARAPRYAGGGGVGSTAGSNPVLRRSDLDGLRFRLDAPGIGTLTGHMELVANAAVANAQDFNNRTGRMRRG